MHDKIYTLEKNEIIVFIQIKIKKTSFKCRHKTKLTTNRIDRKLKRQLYPHLLKKQKSPFREILKGLFCTLGRNRTGTSVTSLVFETNASTSSATKALSQSW